MKTLDIRPGQHFGELTVLEIVPGKKRVSPRRVRCRCACGREYLAIPHALVKGTTVRCYDCWPKRRTKEQIAFRRRFNNYQHSSKRKNLSFTFTVEEFREFYDAPCTYCGLTPAQGIDRRNNAIGYLPENSVPCCAQCNYAKRDMPERAFLAWVARVAAKQGFSL